MKIVINKRIIQESILSDIRDAYNHNAPEDVAPTNNNSEVNNAVSQQSDLSKLGVGNTLMGQKASENYSAQKPIRDAQASLTN